MDKKNIENIENYEIFELFNNYIAKLAKSNQYLPKMYDSNYIAKIVKSNQFKKFTDTDLPKMYDSYLNGFIKAMELNENKLNGKPVLTMCSFNDSNIGEWAKYDKCVNEIKAIIDMWKKQNNNNPINNKKKRPGIFFGSSMDNKHIDLMDIINYLASKIDDLEFNLKHVVNHLNIDTKKCDTNDV